MEVVFARQLAAFGGRNDIAVGLSTSGNSANLVRAFDEASRRGMLTIGLAGYEGGQMAVVDTGQGEETVSVALVSAGVGDTILVHAREAIAVVGAPS